MSVVTVETGTYSSLLDYIAKFKTFIETNGWTVVPSSGIDTLPLDPFPKHNDFSFAGDWYVAYSDATSNPNPWLSAGHERIFFIFGRSDNWDSSGLVERFGLYQVKYADMSVVSIALVDMILGYELGNIFATAVGSDNRSGYGINAGTGASSYTFVTDGTPTNGGSYVIHTGSTGSTAVATENGVGFVGATKFQSRTVRALGEDPLGVGSTFNLSSGATTIDMSSVGGVPIEFNPAFYNTSSLKLSIVDQSLVNSANAEYITVNSVNGSDLIISALANDYENPILGFTSKPEVFVFPGEPGSAPSFTRAQALELTSLYPNGDPWALGASGPLAAGAPSYPGPIPSGASEGLDFQTGMFQLYPVGINADLRSWQLATFPDVYCSSNTTLTPGSLIVISNKNDTFQSFKVFDDAVGADFILIPAESEHA